jgi:hypothetical protein
MFGNDSRTPGTHVPYVPVNTLKSQLTARERNYLICVQSIDYRDRPALWHHTILLSSVSGSRLRLPSAICNQNPNSATVTTTPSPSFI